MSTKPISRLRPRHSLRILTLVVALAGCSEEANPAPSTPSAPTVEELVAGGDLHALNARAADPSAADREAAAAGAVQVQFDRAQDESSLQTFLDTYGDAPQAAQARTRLGDLRWARVGDSYPALESFIADHPDHPRAEEAKATMMRLDYERSQGHARSMQEFLQKYPDSERRDELNAAIAARFDAANEAARGLPRRTRAAVQRALPHLQEHGGAIQVRVSRLNREDLERVDRRSNRSLIHIHATADSLQNRNLQPFGRAFTSGLSTGASQTLPVDVVTLSFLGDIDGEAEGVTIDVEISPKSTGRMFGFGAFHYASFALEYVVTLRVPDERDAVLTRGTMRAARNGTLRADSTNWNSVYAAYLDSLLTKIAEEVPGEIFPTR